MKTVSHTRNCLARLRHLTNMPGHMNVSAAVSALGVAQSTLSFQLASTEHTIGFAIINRTQHLAPTEAGHAFLSEARHLLRLLEEHAK
ncbi:LysR family transcriptional regulator [Nonomuraea sp. MG754425]|uniref:LysR family transcriptional regulator n=1 Tax=Nonomuraea sp. MG754425 TaxID=2570319 RepID=UPI002A033A23|nr:LysR family transcriptional regulator [Nonomuraea sp. MG754425]